MTTKPIPATILVADDNSVNLLILSQILRKNGYRVYQAIDGKKTLEIARSKDDIDLILLDVMMPELDGFDTCRELKQDENLKDIPVMFLSALDDTSSKVKGFEVGAVDYITKPFQEAEILARVQLHLRLSQLEKERLQYIQQLRDLHTQKDHFMGVVSHDLRSPLGGIRSLAQLICEDDDLDIDEIREFAEIMVKSSSQLIFLVNDLLDLAKIESGKMSLDIFPFNFVEVIKDATSSLKSLAESKKISVEYFIEEEIIEVYNDQAKLIQICNNLFSNAIKFTPEKGTVTISIARVDADTVALSIKDSGIGIAADMLPHLFEKFGPHQRMGTSGEKGSGLGMPIVKSYVEAMGGSITVDTEQGQGTEFLIELPIIVEESPKENSTTA